MLHCACPLTILRATSRQASRHTIPTFRPRCVDLDARKAMSLKAAKKIGLMDAHLREGKVLPNMSAGFSGTKWEAGKHALGYRLALPGPLSDFGRQC